MPPRPPRSQLGARRSLQRRAVVSPRPVVSAHPGLQRPPRFLGCVRVCPSRSPPLTVASQPGRKHRCSSQRGFIVCGPRVMSVTMNLSCRSAVKLLEVIPLLSPSFSKREVVRARCPSPFDMSTIVRSCGFDMVRHGVQLESLRCNEQEKETE